MFLGDALSKREGIAGFMLIAYSGTGERRFPPVLTVPFPFYSLLCPFCLFLQCLWPPPSESLSFAVSGLSNFYGTVCDVGGIEEGGRDRGGVARRPFALPKGLL